MPSDITGTDVLETASETGPAGVPVHQGPGVREHRPRDEINRTPPKTQAALLQAMQEREVTAGGNTYSLEPPFFVLATQNPIEQEGTYPLPEAQLDRFMFNIHVDYPSLEDEVKIVEETTSAYEADLTKVLSADDIMKLQKLVRRVPVSDDVVNPRRPPRAGHASAGRGSAAVREGLGLLGRRPASQSVPGARGEDEGDPWTDATLRVRRREGRGARLRSGTAS